MTDNGAPKREDNQLIAAEYVLGVLGVSEWREVEQRIAGDQIFAREVAFWEERLGGLAEGTPAVAPPASAWGAHRGSSRQGRAAGGNACRYMAKPRLLARPCFEHERTCSGVSCRTDLCRRRDTATYTARRATPRRRRKEFLAAVNSGGGTLAIVPAALLSGEEQKAMELWLIPPGDKPHSLGLIDPSRPITIKVPQDLLSRVNREAVLAVSLEPPGGSPTGQPTGPVIANGKLAQL